MDNFPACFLSHFQTYIHVAFDYNLDLLERFSMQTIGEKNNDLSAFCVLLSFSCLCVCGDDLVQP